MSYVLNTQVRLRAEVRLNGVLTDPTGITLRFTDPGGVVTTIPMLSLTHDGTGLYSYILTVNDVGTWLIRWSTTGNVVASAFFSAVVNGPYNITPVEEVIGGTEDQLSDLDARLTTAEGDISALETSVGSLALSITALDGRVDSLETSVAALQPVVDDLENVVFPTTYLIVTPSTVAPAATIEAALASGVKTIYFSGAVQLEDIVNFTQDDVTFIGLPGSSVIPKQFSSALADDGANSCAFRGQATFDGTVSTALAAVAKSGQRQLTLVSGTGVVAGMWLFLSTHFSVTYDFTTDTYTATAHGLQNNDYVRIWSGDPRQNDSNASTPYITYSSQTYYVVNATANTFQISATLGGPVNDCSTNGYDLRVSKLNSGDQPFGMSDSASIQLGAWVQVESVAGAVVTLTSIVPRWFPTRSTKVRSGSPLKRTKFRNIQLSNKVSVTGGETACGIRLEGALDADVECGGIGFSRALVEFQDSTGKVDLDFQGEVNALLLTFSSIVHVTEITTSSTIEGAARVHPHGYVRGAISQYHRSTLWMNDRNVYLRGGCCAFDICGPWMGHVGGVAEDFDTAEGENRNPRLSWVGSVPYGHAVAQICVYDTQLYGEFGFGISFNFRCYDCRTPYFDLVTPKWHGIVDLSDLYSAVGDVEVFNRGRSNQTAGHLASPGLVLFDVGGLQLTRVSVTGHAPAIVVYNFSSSEIIQALLVANDGDGSTGYPGLPSCAVLFYKAAVTTHVRFGRLSSGNYLYPFVHIDPQLPVPLDCMSADSVSISGEVSREVFTVVNNSGSATVYGEILQKQNSSQYNYGTPTSTDGRLCAVCVGYGTSNTYPQVVAAAGEVLVYMDATLAVDEGDLIEPHAGSRNGFVNNSATNPIGYAVTTKGAGVPGYVLVRLF